MKVLIAVDDSHEARDAVSFAKKLLSDDDHAIVLNVVSFDVGPAMAMAFYGNTYGSTYVDPTVDQRLEALDEDAEDAAQQLAESTSEQLGDAAEPRIEHGDAADRICEVAEAEGVDLVVLGTHDRGRFARLWFGSVSDRVVHHAPCPVLVVR